MKTSVLKVVLVSTAVVVVVWGCRGHDDSGKPAAATDRSQKPAVHANAQNAAVTASFDTTPKR
jgi:hypothetical protein